MTVPSMVQINYSEYGRKLYEVSLAKGIPISGGIELTHRCNLRCVHCYVASDKYPPELNTQQWFQIIDQIADAGCFWFYITGGEAMIRPDFLEIYLYAKRRGMSVVVLSNATCISDEIADKLAEYPPQCLEISMYGATEETFDRVGKVKFGYRRFMKGMEKLLVRGIPIKLKTMALKENYQEVLRIRRFAQSLGLSFRYDAVINARLDQSLSPLGHALTPEQAIELEKQDPEKEMLWQHFCSNHMGGAQNENVYQCGAGKSTFNVDPYGRLSVCMLSRRPNYPILEGSFLDGWHGATKKEANRKRQQDSQCTSCDMMSVCGNCTGFYDLYRENLPPTDQVPLDREAVEQKPIIELCTLAKNRVEAFGLSKRKDEIPYDA